MTMKFLFGIVFMIMLFGCSPAQHQKKKEAPIRVQIQTTAIVGYSGVLSICEFEGHKYILFNYDRGGGIIHHPDCNCKERKTK